MGSYAYWHKANQRPVTLNFIHKNHNNPSDKKRPLANYKEANIQKNLVMAKCFFFKF